MYENRQKEIIWNEIEGDIKRLLTYEPVQYVTETAWFYGMPLGVCRDVLIPRPETEELVKKTLEACKNKKLKILDIGTGSGCIAIALKRHLPDAEVYASDISENALKIAEINSKTNNTEIHFIKDDILQSNIQEQFSLIISNPPYITEKEKQAILKNVLDFEPHNALFVPDNEAMKFYKAIASFALKRLEPTGCLMFEINEAYKDDVCSLLEKTNFINIEPYRDINNKWRIIKVQKA